MGLAEIARRVQSGGRPAAVKRHTTLCMTTRQIILMTCGYLTALIAVAYLTRATALRLVGAGVGGAAAGLMILGVVALGNSLGLWQVPFAAAPYFVSLMYLSLAVSCTPIYLITWRVARRFERRGLAIFLGAVAVVGPLRDYWYAVMFPAWIVFAPGLAPVLAVAASYVGMVSLGHGVMRLLAGPAGGDRLARRPRGPT